MEHQVNEFKRFAGNIKLDESYFGAGRITGKREKGVKVVGILKREMMKYILK